MRGSTHLLFGLILAAILTRTTQYGSPLLAVILILVGSLLPDIDESNSILGRRFQLLAAVSKHRTFFHSLLFLVGSVIILSALVSQEYVWAFSLAFVSHLLLDGVTPQGVRPFWPSALRIRGPVVVGSFVEKLIVVIAVITFVIVLLW